MLTISSLATLAAKLCTQDRSAHSDALGSLPFVVGAGIQRGVDGLQVHKAKLEIIVPILRLYRMRLPLFVLALPLGASPIVNSTSVQTTCQWIGNPPNQPDITLTSSSGLGSSSTGPCPAGYVGGEATATSAVLGPADVKAVARSEGVRESSAMAQANAGFEVSGVATQDGLLPLNFVTHWDLLTDVSIAQISVTFYFNGV